MDAIVKVVSKSAKWAPGKPDIPQTVEVVIQATKGNGQKLSITKHLRYQGGEYVGRAYDYRKRHFEPIAFPLGILSGGFTEKVRLAA